MSIFGSKNVHYVDTAIVQVVDDDDLISNFLTFATYQAITVTNDFAFSLQQAVLNAAFRNFERMYDYAKDGDYYYGTPDVSILRNNGGIDPMVTHLETTYPGCEVVYCRFKPLNYVHEAWKYLAEEENYSPNANIAGNWTEYFSSNGVNNPVWVAEIIAYYKADADQVEAYGVDIWQSVNGQVSNQSDPVADTTAWMPEITVLDANGLPKTGTGADGLSYIVTYGTPQQLAMPRPVISNVVGPDETDSFKIVYGIAIPPVIDSSNAPINQTPVTGTVTYFEHVEDLTVPITADRGEDDKEFYQWKIQHGNHPDTGEKLYIYGTYDPTTGQIPSVDSAFDAPLSQPYFAGGTYFPFLFFRSRDNNMTLEPNGSSSAEYTEKWETSKKLADFIGIDYVAFGEEIHQSIRDGENANVDDITTAVMVMGVVIQTEKEWEVEYLYRYFKDLYDKLPDGATNRSYDFYDPANPTMPRQTFAPEGATQEDVEFMGFYDEEYAIEVTDADMRTIFSFDNIAITVKGGVIAPLGDTFTVVDPTTATGVIGRVWNEYSPRAQASTWFAQGNPNSNDQIIRKQISLSLYEEIRITNARQRYDMQWDQTVITSGSDDRLLVMLDHNIAEAMDLQDKEKLYQTSLQIIFNSHVVERTKWYESTWFKIVLIVIVIYLTISGMPGGWEAFALATAAGGTALIVYLQTVFVSFMISLAIGYAAGKLVELIGPEWGVVLAVVVIAAALLTGAPPDMCLMAPQYMTASNLMMVGNGLLSGVQQAYTSATLDLEKDMAALDSASVELWEEIEAFYATQEDSSNKELIELSSYIGTQPLYIPGEAAGAYLDRLAHSGNIGVLSLNLCENYVEESLRLPELKDTYEDLAA